MASENQDSGKPSENQDCKKTSENRDSKKPSENQNSDKPVTKSSGVHPQFYPDDATDARTRGDWRTRYSDKQAKYQIIIEAIWLILLIVICFVLFILILCNVFQRPFGLSESQSLLFNQYLGIILAGMIGGDLYDLKWLIHAVGKGTWNEDRRLWRYITPITSGVLSIFVLIIIGSGLFGLFSTSIIENQLLACSLSFLVGYFSDYMVGRLQDLFGSIFGVDHHK